MGEIFARRTSRIPLACPVTGSRRTVFVSAVLLREFAGTGNFGKFWGIQESPGEPARRCPCGRIHLPKNTPPQHTERVRVWRSESQNPSISNGKSSENIFIFRKWSCAFDARTAQCATYSSSVRRRAESHQHPGPSAVD